MASTSLLVPGSSHNLGDRKEEEEGSLQELSIKLSTPSSQRANLITQQILGTRKVPEPAPGSMSIAERGSQSLALQELPAGETDTRHDTEMIYRPNAACDRTASS